MDYERATSLADSLSDCASTMDVHVVQLGPDRGDEFHEDWGGDFHEDGFDPDADARFEVEWTNGDRARGTAQLVYPDVMDVLTAADIDIGVYVAGSEWCRTRTQPE